MYACKLDPDQEMIHYIAEDPLNFLLLEPDVTRMKWAKVIYNVRLQNVELGIS